jgi:alpha-beta hydrolase superfamily lysophospholipase
VALLVLYVGLLSCGRPADRLILFPPQGPIDAGPATRQMIGAGRRQLEIWTARSPALATGDTPQAYVLEFCGNATRAEQIAQYVADRWKNHPIEAWVVNYPGYGGSAGGARLKLIPPSSLAAYDEIARRAAGRPIFLEANSLGTTAALYVAANRPGAGLVLQNPPPLRNLIRGKYGWWNAWLLAVPVSLEVPKELDSIANAKQVRAPAIFLLADHDEVVPPKYQKLVVDAYAGEKRIIPLSAATHGSSVTGDAAKQLSNAIDWLWQKGSKP